MNKKARFVKNQIYLLYFPITAALFVEEKNGQYVFVDLFESKRAHRQNIVKFKTADRLIGRKIKNKEMVAIISDKLLEYKGARLIKSDYFDDWYIKTEYSTNTVKYLREVTAYFSKFLTK